MAKTILIVDDSPSLRQAAGARAGLLKPFPPRQLLATAARRVPA